MPTTAHNRNTLPRFAALAMFLGFATLVGSAQPPKEEEEDPKAKVKKKINIEDEDPKGTVKKKIVVDDDGGITKKTPTAPAGSPPDSKLDELVRAAEDTRTPTLKAIFAKYAVPFDNLKGSNGTLKVRPVPYRRAEWHAGLDSISVVPLDEAGKARDVRPVRAAEVKAVEHFEGLASAEADTLLKQKAEGIAAIENQAAAEKLLAAALRFHDYSRQQSSLGKEPTRRGKTWDEVRDPLAAKLRDVRLEMLRSAVVVNDQPRIRDAGTRLMNAYPKDAVVAQEVALSRVGEVVRLLNTANHTDHLLAKQLLDDFEGRFPGAGGDAARKARTQLRDIAVKAFTRARDKKAVGDLATARDELARAASLDPTVEGVRDMQRELRSGYPILYVAARHFPVNMSPATARLDSEKQAVELVFEGLLEEIPEENGSVRYRPGAALGLPTAVPGGREFQLRTFERDVNGRPGFNSHDVVGTVKLLGLRGDTWEAYPLPWLAGLPTPKDDGAIRVPFSLGHPDPRAALTFKLLPARKFIDNGKAADDAIFAEKPEGTGPFRFHANTKVNDNAPREMVFVDNPGYGRWRDRTGQPFLREIRLVELAKIDPVAAFRKDELHILPDIPTADIEKFTGASSGLGGKVQVVQAAVNRRVHILAVNLQRPYFQGAAGKALRQGISLAIDREEVLRDVFRAGNPNFHKAMTGPYPPNSWATTKGPTGAVPLVNRDLAFARLKTYLKGTAPKTELELAYPEDDPKAADGCRKIKAQIESLLKDQAPGQKLTINLMPVPLRDLITRVQDEHRYDLAYVPFDYPDDWHPYALGAALDPLAATRGGRNWFSFLVKGTDPDADDLRLSQRLNELRGYRDFTGELAPRAAEAGKLFNDSLPFIPLWQLDRHTVVHTNLKVFVDDTADPANPTLLNPTTVFTGVARWRLE